MHFEGDNMMSVKRSNRSAVMRVLHSSGSMSRKRLAETIKLTPAAITKIVSEMIEDGIIAEGRALPSGGAGRREVLVEIDYRSRCALGIHINRHFAAVSAVWLDGSIIFEENYYLPGYAPADETVNRLCNRLMELVAENGIEPNKILGIGVAVRGLITMDGRVLRNSYGTLDTKNYDITHKIEQLTGYPTVMANNVRSLLAAQMFLSKDDSVRSEFFLRCEDGIGGALSVNKKIWPGGFGQCSEVGHIPVVRRGGRQCVCGKSGCLETIASASAMRKDALEIMSEERTPVLFNRMRDRDPKTLSVDDVLEAACRGDAEVASIVDRSVITLAHALKALIYMIDPEKIVLYGRLFENDYFLLRFQSEMREGVDFNHNVVVEKSRYNMQLESCSAALLMVEHFFDRGGMKE